MRAPNRPRATWRRRMATGTLIVVATTTIVITGLWQEQSMKTETAAANSMSGPSLSELPRGTMRDTPMIMPAFQLPEMSAADDTSLPADTPIVGVQIGSEVRAYSLEGMSAPSTHVINDWLGEKAITVAYCDRTDCVRVFDDETLDSPLELRVGGWHGGQMQIVLNDAFYRLDAIKIPLSEMPFERSSWGEWKERFPDSRIFIGGQHARFLRIMVGGRNMASGAPPG